MVYKESSYYLLYSCTNPILGKNLVPEIWAKMLSVNQTAGFLNWHYLQNTKIFRALVYLEPWHIRNPGVFRTRGIFRTLLYSEPSHIQDLGVFCENSFHALWKIIMNSFNTCVIFTPIVFMFILCKKDMEAQGARAMNFDIP